MEELASQTSLEEKEKKQPEKTAGKGWRKALLICAVAVGVLVAACAVLCGVASGRKTVCSGTTLLGVDVSGKTQEEIRQLWEKEGPKACQKMGISLMQDEKELRRVTLSELGVTITPEDAVAGAWEAGHGTDFFRSGLTLVHSWFGKAEVTELPLTADEKALEQSLKRLSEEMATTTVDGSYRLDEKKSDGLYVTKPRDGVKIDSDKLTADVRAAIAAGELEPIRCKYTTEKAKPIDLAEVYEKIHGEMKNAGYDRATGELTDSRIGVEFDVEAGKKLLEKAEPGAELVVPATVEFPKVNKEQLKDVLFRDCLGSYTTWVGGSYNRVNNIYLATGVVNGSILNSGETFSYNDTIGEPSADKGYGTAPGYVGGKTVDVYGGGVCQVSSTMYYATLLSNLEIVDRSCHQYAPGYITWGCDATTFYPWPDYVFRNNTDYPIKIVATIDGGALTVSLYGTKVDDTYVRMVSETLYSTPMEEEFVVDETLAPGAKVLEEDGYTGYYVRTWRNVYAGDGTLLSSTVEDDSDYEMRPAVWRVGPEKKEPEKPAEPVQPAPPVEPTTPIQPTTPIEPTTPIQPTTPEPTPDTGEGG